MVAEKKEQKYRYRTAWPILIQTKKKNYYFQLHTIFFFQTRLSFLKINNNNKKKRPIEHLSLGKYYTVNPTKIFLTNYQLRFRKSCIQTSNDVRFNIFGCWYTCNVFWNQLKNLNTFLNFINIGYYISMITEFGVTPGVIKTSFKCS